MDTYSLLDRLIVIGGGYLVLPFRQNRYRIGISYHSRALLSAQSTTIEIGEKITDNVCCA
jgi:hypothetical protein